MLTTSKKSVNTEKLTDSNPHRKIDLMTGSGQAIKNRMRYSMTAILVAVLFLSGSAMANGTDEEEQRRAETFNLDDGLALEGYDPVSYFIDLEPSEGDSDISANYKGVTYYFASGDNRNTFFNDPESYEPRYGGYCAYTMLDGDKQSVNPENYKIVDGQLLLFYRMRFGIINALNRWNSLAGETEGGDQVLMQQAEAHWVEMQ